MNSLDRIWGIFRSTFNSIIGIEEDPEKILETAIEQLEQDLIFLRQSLAQAIALSKRTERQIKHNEAYAQQWYHRAQIALAQQLEDLARESLFRRQSHLSQIDILQEQIQQQTVTINQLRDQLRLLEGKVSEMKLKKDLYIARSRSAATSQKLASLGNLEALEKIEQRLLELEAQAELNLDPLEAKFKDLQINSKVEAELTKLKINQTPESEEIKRLRAEIENL
ncbi:PspA/IM30 family protein [Gloeocapsa sp. PCC 73106]|uniref:PspA/IM30 family protein n=1 Tax=Gloeocapsa sp. PCC 73106 TaxID=102232 RepID=UPI0002AC0DBB|nr:PspA/IM30 family protein [Gloeocapsa sp. PCC 73106]ELR97168.1 phage shock protein A (IM30), suppresses sigma54-dependent transcription [Gloeocapsa sp. PCC 73106]